MAAIVVLGVATSCSNAESGGGSGGEKVEVPTDGGEENRDVKKDISGVPGVTDDAIKYAVVGTEKNNPLGTCILDCYVDGITAYFAYRNDEGGIYGRKLEIGSVADDQVGSNQAEALKITSSDDAFGSFQAGLFQQGWGDLNDAGVPTYTWGIDGPSAANREAIFPSTVIGCTDCTRRHLPYVAMKAGAKQAAALGYGTTANAQECTRGSARSFELYEEDTGVEQVYMKDDLTYGLPNGVGPEVSEMKRRGVDFIATCMDLNAMKTLAQALRRAGMDDVVLYHSNTYNQEFVRDADGLFEGDYIDAQFRPFEAEQNDATKAFRKWMKETGSEPSELAMVGWINATLAFEGLLAAGPSFDRAKVIAATNAMTDFTADGLIPSIDWTTQHVPYTQATREDRKELECATAVKVVDDEFEAMNPPSTPWECWESSDITWSEPELTDFD